VPPWVKRRARSIRRFDNNIIRQVEVHRIEEGLRWMLRLSVEGHNLSQCMDTRIGTAGGFYSKAFTCQRMY
jgi:hypothetical protein